MAYIGNAPGQSTQRITTTFTATQGQTDFNPVSGYTPGYADVYLNGVKLVDTNDYTAIDGVTVVLNQGATLDDVVEVLAYVPRGLTDGYTKIEADARYATEAQGTLADSAVQPNDDVALGALSADGFAITASTPSIQMTDSDNNADAYIQATDGNLRFYADDSNEAANSIITFNIDGSEEMRINSDGNVGIGTNSPDSLLEIVGADPVLTIRDTETAGALTNATLRLAESGASDTLNNYWDINYAANGFLVFKNFDGASLSEVMRIDSSGLEIGTSSGMIPTASLAINENVGGTPAIEIIPNSDDNNNETATIRLWGTKFGTANRYSEIKNITDGSTASNELAFDTNGTEAMRISSLGNLLVGTTNDNSRLTLNQSGDETISIFDSRTATSGVFRSGITWRDYLNNPTAGIYYEHNEYFGTAPRALVFKPAGASEKMRLSATGQLRLGTSTENANILIRSEANTPWLNCTNNSEGAFGFHLYNDGTDQGTAVPFARMGINYSGTRNSSINFHRGTSSTGGFMAFTTDTDVERMRIDPSGYVTMPYQPAFWAWNSGIQSSEGAVVFVSTDLNNGGHYNTSTGRFTAPVSGIYEFQAMALFRKEGTGGSGEITLYVNGSNVSIRGLVYGGAGTADGSHYPLSFTYRRYLNANDYAQLYIHDLSAAGSDMYLSSRLSWFSGRLIG